MEFISKLADTIHYLSKKDFQRYLGIFLAGVGVIVIGIVYYIYSQNNELMMHFKKIEKLSDKALILRQQFEKIQTEEVRLADLLAQNKDFSLNSYFETFYKRQNIKPEDGWRESPNVINSKFDEMELSATFKDQTTEKMVKILEEIDKTKIVYVKKVHIKTEKNKRITFDITLSTLKEK
ncbi:MAG: hypothetical protein ABH827_03900 [bacterium]